MLGPSHARPRRRPSSRHQARHAFLALGFGAAHWLVKQSGGLVKAWIGSAGRLPKVRYDGALEVLRELGPAGWQALDVGAEQRRQLEERLVLQLRMISKGAYYWYRREQEKMTLIPGNVKEEQ